MKVLKTILLAAAAVLAASGAAQAQRITTFAADKAQLKDLRSKAEAARINVPADKSFLLKGISGLSRLDLHSGADGLAGDIGRLELNPDLARLRGDLRQSSERLHRLDPIPLAGKGVAPRVIAPGALPRLQDHWNRIVEGDVGATEHQPLTTKQLSAGVPLGNGWVLCFGGKNSYSLVDLNTGNGFRVWGDPHLDAIRGNVNTGHYGDWTSDAVLLVLPGKAADFPTLVLAWSTGGDEKNGFGLPTNCLVVDRDRFVWVEGLGTDAPTGVACDGAMFAYQGFADEFGRAHRLHWTAGVGELRTPTGDRPAPPANARDYTRSAAASPVRPDQLFGDTYRLSRDTANGEIPAMDRELFERFRHSVSAAKCGVKAVAAPAGRFQATAKELGGKQATYLAERGKMIARNSDLKRQLNEIYDFINSPTAAPAAKAKAAEKSKALTAEKARLDKEIDELDRAEIARLKKESDELDRRQR